MKSTTRGSTQVKPESITRAELNASTTGLAVIRKVIAGTGISITQTGPDNGTGDVTINNTGAAGTVTSITVTGANGIGVTGSPITNSGTIALSLGAITPASVAATGTVTGSNLSGTNTGDQIVPVNTVGITDRYFSAYNATTGVFTQTDITINGDIRWQLRDINLTTWASVSRASGFDSFVASPTLANLNTLVNDANLVPDSRTISTTVPLTGGGDLSANRTFAINDAAADGTTKGAATFTASDFNATSGLISIDYTNGQTANGSTKGFLTAADWTTFNGKQPLDGDLTSLAAASLTGAWYYRSAADTWNPVNLSSQFRFQGGLLRVVQFSGQLLATSDDSVVAAATTDLTGLGGPQIQVTGNTGISAITLAEGEQRILRFSGTPTITAGASLLTPGGENIPVTANSWAEVLGGAAGVVTVLSFHNANDYSRQTFDNIYMNISANIGFLPSSGNVFDIGRYDPSIDIGAFWRFGRGANPALIRNDNDVIQVSFNLNRITSSQVLQYPNSTGMIPVIENAIEFPRFSAGDITAERLYNLPDYPGTFSLIDGTETLTNKTINASQLVDGTVTFAKLSTAAWSNDPDDILLNPSATVLPTTEAVASAMAVYVSGQGFALYGDITGGFTSTAQIKMSAGSTATDSAGLRLQSGALQTTPQAGAIEFLTDVLYFTRTTSATRFSVALAPSTGPITFTGSTAARTITVPNLDFTVARSSGTNTFTGVQTMTSPALTTPTINGTSTGTGVATAATASTLVLRDGSGDITTNRLIAGAAVRLKGYTVATLPAGTQGDTAYATDLLTPTFLVAAVGGGAVVGPCFYNGGSWVTF